ncbi:MAG: hypothetical protein U0T84_10470 [Chitinophagales bacterium]
MVKLVYCYPYETPKFYIDPGTAIPHQMANLHIIRKTAVEGVAAVARELMALNTN